MTKSQYREIRNRLTRHVAHRAHQVEPEDQQARVHLGLLSDRIAELLAEHELLCNHTADALKIVAEIIELRDTYIENPGLLVTH